MSAHKPRVLVIDDEPQIHRFLGPALEAAGYEHARAEALMRFSMPRSPFTQPKE